jgi:hypothetical protein
VGKQVSESRRREESKSAIIFRQFSIWMISAFRLGAASAVVRWVLVKQYRGISFRWDPVGMRRSASNEYSELERCNAKKTKSHVVTSLRVVKTGEAFEKMLFFFLEGSFVSMFAMG